MATLFLIIFSLIATFLCFIVSEYIGGKIYGIKNNQWQREIFVVGSYAFDKGILLLGFIFLSWVAISLCELWAVPELFKRLLSLINTGLLIGSLLFYTNKPPFITNDLIKILFWGFIAINFIVFLMLWLASGKSSNISVANGIAIFDFILSFLIWIIVVFCIWYSFNRERGMPYMRVVVGIMFICCIYTQVMELGYEKNDPANLKPKIDTLFSRIPDCILFPKADSGALLVQGVENDYLFYQKSEALRSIGRLLYRPLFLLSIIVLSLTWLSKIQTEAQKENQESDMGNSGGEVVNTATLREGQRNEVNSSSSFSHNLTIYVENEEIVFNFTLPEKGLYGKEIKCRSYPSDIVLPIFYLYFFAKYTMMGEKIDRKYFIDGSEIDKWKRETASFCKKRLSVEMDTSDLFETDNQVTQLKQVNIILSPETIAIIEEIFRKSDKVKNILKNFQDIDSVKRLINPFQL